MIQLILFWILDSVDTPNFIWAIFRIHCLFAFLRFASDVLKSIADR